MPTEVTAAPFRYEQQLPLALEHPRFYNSFTSSPIPPIGPARLSDVVPNQILPNGVRNPWAPYSGETYRPAAEYAGYVQAQQLQLPPAIGPRAGFGAGARMPLPASYPRSDEGWNGSYGRAHNGHAPDMFSTSGVIGPVPSASSWAHQPSSCQNHARMSPIPIDPHHLAPPIPNSLHSTKYTPRAIPIADACPSCAGDRRARASSTSSNGYRDRRETSQGPRRHANSPAVESPLRRVAEVPLARKISRSSSKRSSDCDHCRECCKE